MNAIRILTIYAIVTVSGAALVAATVWAATNGEPTGFVMAGAMIYPFVLVGKEAYRQDREWTEERILRSLRD